MPSRLPIVGGDQNTWGTTLNDFLSQAHNADGSLKPLGPYYYLPSGWDSAWKAAKANVGSARASVTLIGDSLSTGQGGTDIMIDSWWAKFRAALLVNYSLGGDYYDFLYSSTLGVFTATPPIVINGTQPTNYTAYYAGFNQALMSTSTTLTPWITCTPPYAVTGFDILYIDYATASPAWNYQVDAGATTNVITTGANTFAGASVKKVSITGLSSATHTLKINLISSGANTCGILGVAGYSGTTGICFANMGQLGMGLVTGQNTNNDLADTASFPPDKLALYQGYQGTTAAPTALTGNGFPAQPDLAIIALGINDATQSVSRASFRDALDRLIWSLRFGKSDACSIIIAAMYTNDGNIASSTVVANQDYTSAAAPLYRDLEAAMLECAQINGCAFVDVHSAFGRKPVTNGWITSVSDIHPTPAGHLKIANLLSPIV